MTASDITFYVPISTMRQPAIGIYLDHPEMDDDTFAMAWDAAQPIIAAAMGGLKVRLAEETGLQMEARLEG